MGRRSKRTPTPDQPPLPSWLAPAVALLLLLGLGASVYLGHLYYRVHRPGGGPVDSFCNINQSLNCVTVATSDYSSFLGLPIALHGMEFFAGCLAVVLLSASGRWRVRRWDSLLLLPFSLGLAACGVLAWISAYRIHSFCIMCCLVYSVVALVFLLLVGGSGRRPGSLLRDGPRELWSWLCSGRGGAAALVLSLIWLSQLFWFPRLMQVQAAPAPAINHQGLPSHGLTLGPAGAPVRIEEFTDFQCPYCGQAHEAMMQLMSQFKGKIQLIHRDYPLDSACNPKIDRPFHPQACSAAVYARCASRQNKYWPYEKLLFYNRIMLSEPMLENLAEKVGLDLPALRACVKEGSALGEVKRDIDEASRRGVEGTPTLFVNGEKVVGARPLEFWVEKIGELLNK